MQKEPPPPPPPPPPQLPFSVHKKQVRKRMASVGEGGWMEGENVFVWHIYVCVKQKWNKKKIWNIYAILSNVCCFLLLSSISLRLLHLINFSSSGK